ncbi:MAG: hypothetical protein DI563_00545 [Variovorax paradoxus]|uniref:Uncharacterized protein n=1 Tax=Variovorax paradoxus TaxID=34073 RepID=A0A2W5QM35_VARPD|nr:MAG: hypothetical protein DI563_00545 [Variovorax paradoxus]
MRLMKPATKVDDRWAAHLIGASGAFRSYPDQVSTKTERAKWYAKMDAPSRVGFASAWACYAMSVPVTL